MSIFPENLNAKSPGGFLESILFIFQFITFLTHSANLFQSILMVKCRFITGCAHRPDAWLQGHRLCKPHARVRRTPWWIISAISPSVWVRNCGGCHFSLRTHSSEIISSLVYCRIIGWRTVITRIVPTRCILSVSFIIYRRARNGKGWCTFISLSPDTILLLLVTYIPLRNSQQWPHRVLYARRADNYLVVREVFSRLTRRR